MAELLFLYYASACCMPSSNKRFSRSFVTSGSRSIEKCQGFLAPSARHSSTIRIITHLFSRAKGNLLYQILMVTIHLTAATALRMYSD